MAIKHAPQLTEATIEDFQFIQNMSMFYLYDISCYCCAHSNATHSSMDNASNDIDLKSYFLAVNKKAILIHIDGALAGYILLSQINGPPKPHWTIDEFFVLVEFKGTEIPSHIPPKLWVMYPGHWTVSVESDNKRSLVFWRKAIHHAVGDAYIETTQNRQDHEGELKDYCVFSFDTGEY